MCRLSCTHLRFLVKRSRRVHCQLYVTSFSALQMYVSCGNIMTICLFLVVYVLDYNNDFNITPNITSRHWQQACGRPVSETKEGWQDFFRVLDVFKMVSS